MAPSIDPPAGADVPSLPDGAPRPGERTPTHPEGCFGCAGSGLRIESWVDDDGRSVRSYRDNVVVFARLA